LTDENLTPSPLKLDLIPSSIAQTIDGTALATGTLPPDGGSSPPGPPSTPPPVVITEPPVPGTSAPTIAGTTPVTTTGTTAPPVTGTLVPGTTAPTSLGTTAGTTAPPVTGTLVPGTTAPTSLGTTAGTTAPPVTGTLVPGTTAPTSLGTTAGTTAPPVTGTLVPGTTAPTSLGTIAGTTAPPITGTLVPGTTAPTSLGTTALTTAPPVAGTLIPGTTAPTILGTGVGTTAPPVAGTLIPGTTAPTILGTAVGTTAPPVTGTLVPGTTAPTSLGTTALTTAPPVAGAGTNAPTAGIVGTIAPTSIPDSSLYYRSFEQGNFPFTVEPEDPVFTTENTVDGALIWSLTTEKAKTGVKSLKTPTLENINGVSSSANLTLSLPDFGATGELHYSVFNGAQMPFDNLEIIVNDKIMEVLFDATTAFEERVINLEPGVNVVKFVYKYNPASLPVANLPPPDAFPNRIGTVFIDDVYYIPSAAAIVRASIREECVPLGSNPESFEVDKFPLPPWSTSGDAAWAISTDKAYDGTTSLRSPNFDDRPTAAISNATLQVCDEFPGGLLKLQMYASVQPPRDMFEIYIDGQNAAQLVDVNEWTVLELGLEPGPHRIDFSFQYNMFNSDVGLLPPSPAEREGK